MFHLAQFVFKISPASQTCAFFLLDVIIRMILIMMFETFAEQDRAQSWFDIGLRLRRRTCSFTLITLLLVIVVFVVSCTLMRAGCDLHITIHMDAMKISRPFFCFICHKDVAVTLIPKFPRCTVVFFAVVCQVFLSASLSTPHTMYTFQETLQALK